MKRAVVVGGSSGIGAATASALHGASYRVIATGATVAECATASAHLDAAIELQVLDVKQADAVQACFAGLDRLDALVNAAGIGRGAPEFVNLASVMSFFGSGTAPAYAASKGAIAQFTKSLAVAWAAEGIRTNAAAPGWIDTPMTQGMQADAVYTQRVLARSPMKRWGRAEEIAAVIAFLVSPAASFVNGAIMPVDGGYMAVGI